MLLLQHLQQPPSSLLYFFVPLLLVALLALLPPEAAVHCFAAMDRVKVSVLNLLELVADKGWEVLVWLKQEDIAVPSGGLIPAMLHHTVESNVQSIENMMVITNALLQLAGRQETRIGTLEAKQKADVASLHGTIHGIEEKIDEIERKIAN